MMMMEHQETLLQWLMLNFVAICSSVWVEEEAVGLLTYHSSDERSLSKEKNQTPAINE